MRFFTLNEEQKGSLNNEPEFGMGYQLVRGNKLNDRASDLGNSTFGLDVVVAGAFVISHDKRGGESEFGLNEILCRDFGEALLYSDIEDYEEGDEFRTRTRFMPKFPNDPGGFYAGKLPLFYSRTRHGDEFRRLSAYQNDSRIKNDGSVTPGTYTTTVNDVQATPSGLAAVGRYALPTKLPASFVFHIIPPPNTPILYSTVRPAFGFAGGGVEVYFPHGCPAGSAKLLSTLPEM